MDDKGVLARWIYKGRDCVVVKLRNHFCAYVETKLSKVGYSDYDDFSPESLIRAHGGITYAGKFPINDSSENGWYFGIDFSHYGDYIEFENGLVIQGDGHRWTLDEVKKECERLADGVTEYEEKFPRIKDFFDRHKNEISDLKKELGVD